MVSRRGFVAAASGLAACSRKRDPVGYRGYAFVANAEGQAVAAVDLTAMALIRHIRLEANPTGVSAHPKRPEVLALMTEAALIQEIRPDLTTGRKLRLPGPASLLAHHPRGGEAWAMCPKQRQIVRIALDRFEPLGVITLPAEPVHFAFAPDRPDTRDLAAVTLGDSGEAALIRGGQVERVRAGGSLGLASFRSDGRYLIVADRGERQVVFFDVARGRVAVRLPVAVRPDYFCFKQDGGQLFVSGEGADAVVTVYPFQTEVGSFALAGRSPGHLAVSGSPEYLFAANPPTGDVTIVNVRTQKMAARAQVGREPAFIAVTPDDQLACVLNRGSGDMAVIHIPTINARRNKSASLMTMIPVGSLPVSAVIKPA